MVKLIKQLSVKAGVSIEEASTVAVLGKNKLNIYCGKELYQVKSSKRVNALKYVDLFYRSKNLMRDDENGTFLGL